MRSRFECPDNFDYDLNVELNRQEAWDERCKNAPKCACCGDPVILHDTYLEYEDLILCEECMDRFTSSTMDLE